MTFRCNGPSNGERYPDYEIVIDLSERVYEPIPDEIADALR